MPRSADQIKDTAGAVADQQSSSAAAPAADSLTAFASAQGNQAMVSRMTEGAEPEGQQAEPEGAEGGEAEAEEATA